MAWLSGVRHREMLVERLDDRGERLDHGHAAAFAKADPGALGDRGDIGDLGGIDRRFESCRLR